MWKTVKYRCGAWLFEWVSPAILGFLDTWIRQYTQDVVVRAIREYEWRHAGRGVRDCLVRYVDVDGHDIAGDEVIASKDRTQRRTYHGKTYATCRQESNGVWVYREET